MHTILPVTEPSYEIKRRLQLLLKEKERRLGLTNLHYFSKHICGYQDLTSEKRFHGDFCRHMEDAERHFKLTLTPRGSLKTSVGTVAHSCQEVVKNPNIRILIASKKFTVATDILSEIKGHFEKNMKFRDLYGDMVGKDTWSKTAITVATRTNWKKEPTISCAGVDVTNTGLHYDRIKVDDPHDALNTTSQEMIDKVVRWYGLLFSLLDPGGYLDINGTIWHYNDLYNYIITKERERVEKGKKKRFSIFIRDSFEGTNEDLLADKIPRNKFLWPERLSPEFLQDTFIEQGPYIFSCQYRLRPIDDESAVFKRSWIQTCKPHEVPRRLRVFSSVDPMQNQDGTDYLAIVTVGVSDDWKFYILDVKRQKADEHDTVDLLQAVYKRWRPEKIGIESIAWQETYYRYVKMLQMQQGFRLPMVELKQSTRVSKPRKIKSMVPYWKAGLYIVPCNSLETLKGAKATLIDELTRYPRTANDDTVDALQMMNQLAGRPNILAVLRKQAKQGSFLAERALATQKKTRRLGERSVRNIA